MHRFDPRALGLASESLVQVLLEDDAATRRLGARVASHIKRGGFVGLIGELGAGKTTFVQGLVEALTGGEASSPTYTLLNEYPGSPSVYHFDLYRLASADELETIGYWDYVETEHAVVVVEWIDQVPTAWFGRGAVIEICHDSGARRASLWAATDTDGWRAAVQGP